MLFDNNGLMITFPSAYKQRPEHGQGKEGHELFQAIWLGHMGLFQVEAS